MNTDDLKNIYLIKCRLAELTLKPAVSCYTYYVGHFILRIFTPVSKAYSAKVSFEEKSRDRITHHEKVQVNLYELKKFDTGGTYEKIIDIPNDSRFTSLDNVSNYNSNTTTTVIQLCELIKYLYRLNNLSAFL